MVRAAFSTATVTVDVNPVNDAPVAVNDTATTPEDTPVTVPFWPMTPTSMATR